MKHWLVLLTLLIAQLFHLSAQANLLPPKVTNYTSSSLVSTDPPKTFRVDHAALTIQCRYDCTVEAEYTISSNQSTETLLLFVLPEQVNIQATVNEVSIPVSGTSGLEGFPLQRKNPFLKMNFLFLQPPEQFESLFYASFMAAFDIFVTKYGHYVTGTWQTVLR